MNRRPVKILVNKNTPNVVETFSHLGDVIALETQEITREAVRDCDLLIVRSETKVNGELLEGSSVRFVGTVTIGTDHIDKEYLASRTIAFASAPGSNSNSVAEYVAAALLVWSRRTGQRLAGKTIGIVGVGNVGSKVVQVADALGLKVLRNDPPLARATGDPVYRSLDELMDADIITLHVPLHKGIEKTHHLFDGGRIGRMKRGSIVINTSRGAVVDSSALLSSLHTGHLSTAILDVWEDEPAISTELLKAVVLGTPHVAGYSLDGKLNALRMVYESACVFLGVSPTGDIFSAPATTDGAEIRIPGNVLDKETILAEALRHAYDIELDDLMLRRILSMKESERGKFFMTLRAEYRIRREFRNRRVVLSSGQASVRSSLEHLGFIIEIRKEAH